MFVFGANTQEMLNSRIPFLGWFKIQGLPPMESSSFFKLLTQIPFLYPLSSIYSSSPSPTSISLSIFVYITHTHKTQILIRPHILNQSSNPNLTFTERWVVMIHTKSSFSFAYLYCYFTTYRRMWRAWHVTGVHKPAIKYHQT